MVAVLANGGGASNDRGAGHDRGVAIMEVLGISRSAGNSRQMADEWQRYWQTAEVLALVEVLENSAMADKCRGTDK